jgi:lysophospholipase L1-like esterase
LCLFFALALLLPTIAACAKATTELQTEPVGSSSESEASTEKPTEKATKKPKETKPADFDDQGNITLDGWSDYVIVRGAECTDSEKTAAIQIRNYIKRITGATLDVITDANAPAEKEIVVGKTNRDASIDGVDGLGMDEYVCKTVGTKYLVSGTNYGTTWHAVDSLEKLIKDEIKKGTATLDLKTSGKIQDSYELKKVACVGDSITRGSQALPDNIGPSEVTKSWGASATAIYFEQYLGYPSVMQRELWQEYVVLNFGEGGRTLTTTKENVRYRDCAKFTECLEYSNREDVAFDLVLIMLGTNDAGLNGNLNPLAASQKTDFPVELKFLADSIAAGSPDAQFVLMNAPHRCDGSDPLVGFRDVREVQAKAVETLREQMINIVLYDMNRFTIENLTSDPSKEGKSPEMEVEIHEEYYNLRFGANDKLHPSYLGYGKIAEGMRELAEFFLGDGNMPTYLIV